MKTYGERLAYAMKMADDMSQAEIARRAGIKQQSIQYLIMKWKGSRLNATLARILNVRPEWLETGKPPMRDAVPEPSNVSPGPIIRGMVPLISWVSAGRWRECDMQDEPIAWIPVTFTAPRVFALRVEGDSMMPDYPPGIIVFVDPDRKPEPMNLVIAMNNDGEATFKRLTREGGTWYLTPLNTRYPLQPLDSLCKIIGVVIWTGKPEV